MFGMMLSFITVMLLQAVTVAPNSGHCRYQTIPERINKGSYSWKAEENVDFSDQDMIVRRVLGEIGPDMRLDMYKKFSKLSDPAFLRSSTTRMQELIAKIENKTEVKLSFHVSEKWSRCSHSFNHIFDQAACGNCWAVSSASVMSDRTCIGKTDSSFDNKLLSSDDLLRCCTINGLKCGGCMGGYELESFMYWKDVGVVTGNDFGDQQSCKPGTFRPGCGSPCSAQLYDETRKSADLSCATECTNIDIIYADDKHKANDIYFIGTADFDGWLTLNDTEQLAKLSNDERKSNQDSMKLFKATMAEPSIKSVFDAWNALDWKKQIEAIKFEIMERGPVAFAFFPHEDFLYYKSGIYSPIMGKYVYAHLCKVVGWGVENGIEYWDVVNIWGTDWGENGKFRLKIEDPHTEKNIPRVIVQTVLAGVVQ